MLSLSTVSEIIIGTIKTNSLHWTNILTIFFSWFSLLRQFYLQPLYNSASDFPCLADTASWGKHTCSSSYKSCRSGIWGPWKSWGHHGGPSHLGKFKAIALGWAGKNLECWISSEFRVCLSLLICKQCYPCFGVLCEPHKKWQGWARHQSSHLTDGASLRFPDPLQLSVLFTADFCSGCS